MTDPQRDAALAIHAKLRLVCGIEPECLRRGYGRCACMEKAVHEVGGDGRWDE